MAQLVYHGRSAVSYAYQFSSQVLHTTGLLLHYDMDLYDGSHCA